MHVENELPHLVKLLDDDDPAVRQILSERFATCRGDVSAELVRLGITLANGEQSRLSELLAPGRRRQIRHQWVIPQQGFDESNGDWESFELLLRLLSELLHDGTSLRPTLPDALDQITDEAILHDAHRDERSLCRFLFESGRFQGNKADFYHPGNADLLWIIMNRKGNPIGLTVLAMLIAHRLGLCIGGCNFPAHFLAWISVDGHSHLVDCFGAGRLIPVEEIRSNSAVLTPDSRRAIRGPCSMRDILLRILRNLHLTFTQHDRGNDAGLIDELLLSLQPDQ
ncbi:MAG: hypothetical protein CMN05_14300 [Roseibacillus sp.]|nr:hypothetical protein [Roseibacillus sp.]MBP36140.1 hypothetical protein [Roseibacillus sp.]MDP6207076.1 transglutaminase family protein [Roseibacillus sp.]